MFSWFPGVADYFRARADPVLTHKMPKDPTKQRITKKTCENASVEEGRSLIWDTELQGFCLRVTAAGTKTFVVYYRAGGGRTGVAKLYSLGKYGPHFLPEAARAEAKKVLAEVAKGGDPQVERADKRAEMTIAELCDLYIAKGCATKKATTLYTDKSRIERHIKPLLGKKRLSALKRADVQKFLSDVAAGKTATKAKPSRVALIAAGVKGEALAKVETRKRTDGLVTGGEGTATRTLGLLGAILEFAMDRGLLKENPVRRVKRFRDRKMERFLSPAEVGQLGKALEEMEAEGAHPYGLAIIRLLALTGARKSEIASLRWSEVDLDRGALRLSDSKTGEKTLALSPGAAAILAGIERHSEIAFVFPSTTALKRAEAEKAKGAKVAVKRGAEARTFALNAKGHYQGIAKVWEEARKRADLADVRLHDLRHTFASFGAAGGFGLPVIGKLLGHKHSATTARYAHLADDPIRKANDWIGGEIESALGMRAAR